MKNPSETVRSTIQKRDAHGVIRHGAEWLTLWSDPDSLKTEFERRSAAAVLRERTAIEHRMASAARSLSGNPKLQRHGEDRTQIPDARAVPSTSPAE